MANFGSLLDFVSFLTKSVVTYDVIQREQMERATSIVQDEAKRVIGTYDYGWPELAPSTQQSRVSQGFSANEPGLRTGEMRDSIEKTVHRPFGGHMEGEVGSNEDKLVYFELGTSKQPPRSVLMEAAVHVEKEVVKILGEGAVKPILT